MLPISRYMSNQTIESPTKLAAIEIVNSDEPLVQGVGNRNNA